MKATQPITNRENILDSRDILARIEDLEEEGEDCNDNESAELDALRALEKEAAPYSPDWLHGSTLIRESYFKEYAQELADDIGAVNADAGWPACHIDWEAAAEALKIDYSEVDFGGVTYLVR